MLQAGEVRTKLVTLVKVDVEREDIDESELEVFGGREVRVRHQTVRIRLTRDVAQLAQETLNLSGSMPADDRRRNLLADAVHQHARMALTTGDAVAHLVIDLFALARGLQKTRVLHPGRR